MIKDHRRSRIWLADSESYVVERQPAHVARVHGIRRTRPDAEILAGNLRRIPQRTFLGCSTPFECEMNVGKADVLQSVFSGTGKHDARAFLAGINSAVEWHIGIRQHRRNDVSTNIVERNIAHDAGRATFSLISVGTTSTEPDVDRPGHISHR